MNVSFGKVFINEFVHFHVFLWCERVDLTVFQYKVWFEIDSMIPGLGFGKSFSFLLVKNIFIGYKLGWYHFF